MDILDEVYQTGRKDAAGFKEKMKIVFDEVLPKWNDRAVLRRRRYREADDDAFGR